MAVERMSEHSAEKDAAVLIEEVEENGCDHPTYFPDGAGRYVARRLGGWCSTCEEWLAQLRPMTRVFPPEGDTQ